MVGQRFQSPGSCELKKKATLTLGYKATKNDELSATSNNCVCMCCLMFDFWLLNASSQLLSIDFLWVAKSRESSSTVVVEFYGGHQGKYVYLQGGHSGTHVSRVPGLELLGLGWVSAPNWYPE
jgi:hypothetical protein